MQHSGHRGTERAAACFCVRRVLRAWCSPSSRHNGPAPLAQHGGLTSTSHTSGAPPAAATTCAPPCARRSPQASTYADHAAQMAHLLAHPEPRKEVGFFGRGGISKGRSVLHCLLRTCRTACIAQQAAVPQRAPQVLAAPPSWSCAATNSLHPRPLCQHLQLEVPRVPPWLEGVSTELPPAGQDAGYASSGAKLVRP